MDRRLNAFLAIVEHGNITLASVHIGLTQPALTKRLISLEEELGCQLFERSRTGVELTDAGRRFYRRAERIQQEMLQAKEELKSLDDAGLDTLHIGAGPLYHQRYIAPVFSKLLLEFPSLKLDLSVEANELTLPRLMKGEIDIVLGVIQPTGPDGAVLSMDITVLSHGLIIAPEHPLAKLDRIFPKDLKEVRWALYGEDKDTEIWLNNYFQRNGLGAPNIAVRTASFATGMGLAKKSGFVMMAPNQLEDSMHEASLLLVNPELPITNMTTGAYVRPSSMEFPAIVRFLELLKDEVNHAD